MALIRIKPVKDDQSQMFSIAIYHPADADQPIVTTRARYQTAAAAENDVLAIIAAAANRVG